MLTEPAEATAAYRALVDQEPTQVDWRYEFAQFLYEQGRLAEARRQLLILIAQQPNHRQALSLLKSVTREIAGEK